MTDLSDVIRALEEATNGNSELDRLLMPFAGYVLERRGNDRKEWWYKIGGEPYDRMSNFPSPYRDGLPRFTTSIDIALTLVPDGWWGRIHVGPYPQHQEFSAAFWSSDASDKKSIFGCSSDKCPPSLAICIAALRARKEANNG